MSSSDSGVESGSILAKTRADLISEQRKIKKEIQKGKMIVEGLQHDIRIAKEAYNLGESTIMNRTKKIVALFGDTIKNEDEIIEKIKNLLSSIEQDENKIKELRNEIRDKEFLHSQNEQNLSIIKKELETQMGFLSNKKREIAVKESELNNLKDKLKNTKESSDKLINDMEPVSKLINSHPSDDDYFSRLKHQYQFISSSFETPLHILSETSGIRYSGKSTSDEARLFLASICSYVAKRSRMNDEKRRMITDLQEKLIIVNKELNRVQTKESKTKKDIERIESMIQNIKNKRNQDFLDHKTRIETEIANKKGKERKNLMNIYKLLDTNAIIDENCSLNRIAKYNIESIEKIALQYNNKIESLRSKRRINKESQNSMKMIGSVADRILISNNMLLHNLK